MTGVAIVDYGMCNLDSVRRAVEECGATAFVTGDPADLRRADRIILPGVGAFADAMSRIRAGSLDQALADEVLAGGAPFLGVCLGMQLMATIGSEGGVSEGLGWIPAAEVRRLEPTEIDRRVPHVGWNEVHARPDATLFAGLPEGCDFYFVHSFHVRCADDVVAATTPYAGGFVSAIEDGARFGVQFHPEKSQRHGMRVLRNFLAV